MEEERRDKIWKLSHGNRALWSASYGWLVTKRFFTSLVYASVYRTNWTPCKFSRSKEECKYSCVCMMRCNFQSKLIIICNLLTQCLWWGSVRFYIWPPLRSFSNFYFFCRSFHGNRLHLFFSASFRICTYYSHIHKVVGHNIAERIRSFWQKCRK